MNNLLLIAEIVITFSCILFARKMFGKDGLIAWVAMAAILANVIQAKNANLLGLNAAIGHVMFSSGFLATDILTECYGKEEAKKAVWIGLFSGIVYILCMVIALHYTPSPIDTASEHMSALFGLNIRITTASMFMYLVSNYIDVLLYSKIKELTNGKYMWLRNNVSTILCNCGENFIFAFLAFGGIYTAPQIMGIAVASSAVEVVVGICDTPFLYAAKNIK